MSETGETDALAAEYVLGTLDGPERDQAQALLGTDQGICRQGAGVGAPARRAAPDGGAGGAGRRALASHQEQGPGQAPRPRRSRAPAAVELPKTPAPAPATAEAAASRGADRPAAADLAIGAQSAPAPHPAVHRWLRYRRRRARRPRRRSRCRTAPVLHRARLAVPPPPLVPPAASRHARSRPRYRLPRRHCRRSCPRCASRRWSAPTRASVLRRRLRRWRVLATLLLLILLAMGGLVAAWRYRARARATEAAARPSCCAWSALRSPPTAGPTRPPAPPESQFDE